MSGSVYFYQDISSPVGIIGIVASVAGIHSVSWGPSDPKPFLAQGARFEDENYPLLAKAEVQLSEYFRGERRAFDLPLASAGTPFQKTVWQALTEIPFGATISYRELAERVGRPTSFRAVAQAVGANPIAIVVPCHRVIGSDGSLTGFAGGLEAKKTLLSLEGVL